MPTFFVGADPASARKESPDSVRLHGNQGCCLKGNFRLKHYRSLMPLAMEAHKPMFHLNPADGAIGAHVSAVRDCSTDFLELARKIAAGMGVALE